MYILIIFLIITLIILLASLWAYFKTFYNDEKSSDMRRLPSGEQYEPYNPILKSLMDDMDSLEGESVSISLGKRILRSETASMFALSVVSHYLEGK